MRWRAFVQFVAMPSIPLVALLLIGLAQPRAVPGSEQPHAAVADPAPLLAAPRRLVLVLIGTAALASRRAPLHAPSRAYPA